MSHKKIRNSKECDSNSLLEHYNEIMKNLLFNLCQNKLKKPFFETLVNLLQRIDSVPITQVRESVYKLVFQNFYVKNGNFVLYVYFRKAVKC